MDNKPSWPSHCNDEFKWLAKNDPDELIRIIQEELAPSDLKDDPGQRYRKLVDLSFALEIAGQELPGGKIVPILLPFLKHPSNIVVEGAIDGLIPHEETHTIELMEGLEAIEDHPSNTIRKMVEEEIEWIKNLTENM